MGKVGLSSVSRQRLLGLNCLPRRKIPVYPREGIECWDDAAQKHWLPCASMIPLQATASYLGSLVALAYRITFMYLLSTGASIYNLQYREKSVQ